MKTLLSSLMMVATLSLSFSALADEPLPPYMKVRRLIEEQANIPDSKMQIRMSFL